MLLTVKLKLILDEKQQSLLLEFMERFNEACNFVSAEAFSSMNWNRVKLQKQCYYDVRSDFGLSAQTSILVIRKVADTYRSDIENIRIRNMKRPSYQIKEEIRQHDFKKRGAVQYDARCMSWKGNGRVSLLTLRGRIIVTFVLSGKYANIDLSKVRSECDLVYQNKKFYLAVEYNVEEPEVVSQSDFIGVDFGIKNIVATSDGKLFCGDECERVRKYYVDLRRRYQKIGTKSAKRHLARLSKREHNYKSNENHRISKDLVSEAKGTGRGLAIENLTYIPRQRTAKEARDATSKWAFRQLREFIEYKAKLSGIPVVQVNPTFTSQRCSICGYTDKLNRRTQSSFVCLACGYEENADVNAAINIRERAAISQPIVVRHASVA